MKHAGIHWPENAGGEHPNRATIALMPGMAGAALICSPSARYHYDFLRQQNPAATVVWRAIPRQSKLPAQLGWDASKVADECLNLWDEQPHHGFEWFLPLNELQFSKESGQDFRGYAYVAAKLADLRLELEDRFDDLGQNVGLMFPGWVPTDDGDRLHEWRDEAKQWDAICVHCYGDAETMRSRYQSYRDAFPGKLLFVGEWNANHEGHDERAALQMWAKIARDDPLFQGATYFIWETNNAGENDLSIWGNPARLALFQHPPVASLPAPPVEPPAPDPEPIPDPPAPGPDPPQPAMRKPGFWPKYVDIRDGAIEVADEFRMPRRRLLGLCLAEAGQSLQSFDRWGSQEGTRRAKDAIDADDWSALQTVLDEIAARQSNDISFGPCHQAWWWSLIKEQQEAHPEWRYDLPRILEFRANRIEDHGGSLRSAATTLNALKARFGRDDDQFLLERYNKPNAEVSESVRANYQRSLISADRILSEMFPAPAPQPEPAPPSTGIVYEDYRDPEPAGRFTHTPKGIILHGSRSGNAGNSKAREYLGTARYEVANTAGVGWHATIGENVVAVHLTPQEWAWNVRGSSAHWIGVELAQATVDEPITDAQVTALADYIKTRLRPAWPDLPMVFPSHAELDGTPEYGPRDGKSDVFPRGDGRMDDLRVRLLTTLGPAPPAPSPLDVLADRLELARAGLDDGIARPTAAMLKAELLANLDQAWRNVDRVYSELGEIGTELRRVGRETL